MGIGAVYGYKGSNGRAMDMWEEGASQLVCSYAVTLRSPQIECRDLHNRSI